MIASAVAYAELGYRVFPCVPNEKRPMTTNGCKDATDNVEQIKEWWTSTPNANIGISTDDLCVIDVDGLDNEWMDDSYCSQLAGEYVPVVNTPNGRHYYYRGGDYRNTASLLAPKVDTRADGGYVIAPPSIVNGKTYLWAEDLCNTFLLNSVPKFISDIVTGKKKHVVAAQAENDFSIPEGKRNTTLTSIAGKYRDIGMNRKEMLAALVMTNETRCTPILDDKEVEQIVNSVMRYEPSEELVEDIEETTKNSAPGEFPMHLLEGMGLIEEVVEYNLSTAIRPQPVLAFGAAIALQSILCGRKITNFRNTRTNLYVLNTANSGWGKDHGRKVNRKILSAAGMSNYDGPEDFASDAGVYKMLSKSPVVLCQIDEIGKMMQGVNSSQNAYLRNVGAAITRLYSSSNTSSRGKAYADNDKNYTLEQPHLSILGTATPGTIYPAFSTANMDDGLLARFLVFESTSLSRRQTVPFSKVPQSILSKVDLWKTVQRTGMGVETVLTSDMIGLPEPHIVTYTDEATAVMDEMLDSIEPMILGGSSFPAVWARVGETADKLALIFSSSLFNGNLEELVVDKNIAEKACELAVYLAKHMEFVSQSWVAENQFDAQQKRIVRMIQAAGGSISKSALYNKTRYLNTKERDEILDNLKQTGTIKETSTSGKGRPKITYSL